jgi:TATA-box binding protein (TBP) (component of TFIID and TFIIIB)
VAIARAQHQLATQANVHLFVHNYRVINIVGAVDLRAKLDCERFAADNLTEAYLDQESFVGLAWRPSLEPICCEVYSTGRANLPGAKTERSLCDAWSRMFPRLLPYCVKREL